MDKSRRRRRIFPQRSFGQYFKCTFSSALYRTITKDTDDDTLTLSRSLQKSVKGWERPKKLKK